jgi:hypothetical protein
MRLTQKNPERKGCRTYVPRPLFGIVIAVVTLGATRNFNNLAPIATLLSLDDHLFFPTLVEPPPAVMMHLTPPCDDETSSCRLPRWIKDYFRWHRDELRNITQPSDWLNKRIFILQCMDSDSCGGTADRLRPLPFYLAVAARSKRLFFIRWSKPLPLEVFVEPYQLNWTVPEALKPLFDGKAQSVSHSRDLVPIATQSLRQDLWALSGLSQAMTYVAPYRNVVADMKEYYNVTAENQDEIIEYPGIFFHDLFLALFRPVPGLKDKIDRTLQLLDLQPNQFVVTHIRALYPGAAYEKSLNVSDLRRPVENAIDCASYTFEGAPIFVAADASAAKEVAQEYGRTRTVPLRVVSDLDIPNTTRADPLHMDYAQEADPSAYYNIFADLFIMSQSRCVAYGAGGFGRFGSLSSFDPSCNAQHTGQSKGRILKCAPPKRGNEIKITAATW